MSKPSDRPHFALTLEALPDQGGPTAPRRLARGLKYLLRACKFKCIRCEETKTQAPSIPRSGPQNRGKE
jgi:hypothetical protein